MKAKISVSNTKIFMARNQIRLLADSSLTSIMAVPSCYCVPGQVGRAFIPLGKRTASTRPTAPGEGVVCSSIFRAEKTSLNVQDNKGGTYEEY